jgi:putative hydrolase of the HAD superfamily
VDTSRPVRGAAFDIDGTLYPNGAMYRASLPLVLFHLRLFRAFGAARNAIRTRRPVADLHEETIGLVAEDLGWTEEKARSRVEDVIYSRWEAVLRRVPLYPDVPEVLTALRDRGLRLGAMSDFPVSSKLELLGLSGFWDVAFSSEETNYLKPHREPFEELARRMALPPEEVVYVGNSYHYDVVGARAVGFRTAHLCTRRRGCTPSGEEPADFVFADFRELQRWILDGASA